MSKIVSREETQRFDFYKERKEVYIIIQEREAGVSLFFSTSHVVATDGAQRMTL